jgi:SAM-dependent methyltransferase
MAHQQQIEFCSSIKAKFPQFFSNKLVLDVGSLDINGNNAYLFDDCLYLGVDVATGRNVDICTKAHELGLPDASIDVIISTECFEHDQYYELTLNNIVRMLKPGGLFLFTCATTLRAEHGTKQTTPMDAPLLQNLGEWSDYYKNLEEGNVREVIDLDTVFQAFEFSVNDENHDLYFWGIKHGIFYPRQDYSFQINQHHLYTALKEQEKFILTLQNALNERQEQINLLNQALHALEQQKTLQ